MKSIGRNEKCPCGSGKKYKHCCLGKFGDGKVSVSFADHKKLMQDFEVVLDKDDRLRNIGQIMLTNMAGLYKDFDTEGIGCTSQRIGDFSFLTIYNPFEPVTEQELVQLYYDLEKKRFTHKRNEQ